MRTKTLSSVTVLALTIVIAGCKPGPIANSISGTIETDEAHVASRYGGRVEKLFAKEGDLLMCTREMLTGTHVPKWVCRYPSEAEREREATQNWIVKARNCISHCGAETAH